MLVLSKQTRIAATRFVWTGVILNSSESSGQFSNGIALKMYIIQNLLEAKRGVRVNPLKPTPLPMGLKFVSFKKKQQ